MEASFVYQGQRFVWSISKAVGNLAKHNVTFEKACEVFFDPFVRVAEAGADGERRDAAIGFTNDRTALYVVHLEQEHDTIRIISARPATAHERRGYEDDK